MTVVESKIKCKLYYHGQNGAIRFYIGLLCETSRSRTLAILQIFVCLVDIINQVGLQFIHVMISRDCLAVADSRSSHVAIGIAYQLKSSIRLHCAIPCILRWKLLTIGWLMVA